MNNKYFHRSVYRDILLKKSLTVLLLFFFYFSPLLAEKTAIPPGNGNMLPQEGNPINTTLDNYKSYLPGNLEDDKKYADTIVSWQFTSGSFFKGGFTEKYGTLASEEERAANEEYRRSLGCLDNEASTTELALLGDVYKRGRDPKHQIAAHKTLDWLLETQQSSGGWQQWTPARGKDHYSGHATFNDNAMMRVLIILQKAVRKEAPFDSEIFTAEQLSRCQLAIEKGVDYILKSQIIMNGVRTVWCAQHGMYDYEPKMARSYELPSKSGNESVLIVAFLLSCPQTPEIAEAAKAAVNWYRNPETYRANSTYLRYEDNPIQPKEDSRIWYRFYELDTNKGFFCNRDGVPTYNIMKVEKERRDGYVWGGPYGEELLAYAESVGY